MPWRRARRAARSTCDSEWQPRACRPRLPPASAAAAPPPRPPTPHPAQQCTPLQEERWASMQSGSTVSASGENVGRLLRLRHACIRSRCRAARRVPAQGSSLPRPAARVVAEALTSHWLPPVPAFVSKHVGPPQRRPAHVARQQAAAQMSGNGNGNVGNRSGQKATNRAPTSHAPWQACNRDWQLETLPPAATAHLASCSARPCIRPPRLPARQATMARSTSRSE